jgi:hypothetical protein
MTEIVFPLAVCCYKQYYKEYSFTNVMPTVLLVGYILHMLGTILLECTFPDKSLKFIAIQKPLVMCEQD